MRKINIPSKYKFELMKSRGVGTHPSDNSVFVFRDKVLATNGHVMIVVKDVKEEDQGVDVVSTEDLAYLRKKFRVLDIIPVETIECPKIPDFDSVMPDFDTISGEISFNVTKLANLAKAMGTERVKLYLSKNRKPMFVIPLDGNSDKVFGLIMPLYDTSEVGHTYLYEYLESINKL